MALATSLVVDRGRRMPAAIRWRPGDTDREAYETVFVVVGKKAWPVAERFARDFSGHARKTREEAVQTVVGGQVSFPSGRSNG